MTKRKTLLVLISFICLGIMVVSCASIKSRQHGNTYYVRSTVNLHGTTLTLPENGKLVFEHNGRITNGTLVGDNTVIVGLRKDAFDDIHFEGEWRVKEIRSDYFKDVSKDDVLKELIALTSEKIQNKIYITEGDYWVTASLSDKNSLRLKSNTTFINRGTIHMRPNNLMSCSILFVSGNNIKVDGGAYYGERYQHHGEKGEWGHGIQISEGSNHVTINDVHVQDCWGDGIAVDGNKVNTDIKIDGFYITNCRRQGISVIFARDCVIRNGMISNIQGTEPHLGIDIEPNINGFCEDIIVENVSITSEKGIGVFTATKDFQTKRITIQNCKVFTTGYAPFYASRCDGLLIRNNYFETTAPVNNHVIVLNSGIKKCNVESNIIIHQNATDHFCIFSAGEEVTIRDNVINSGTGYAFYTSNALILKNTINVPNLMVNADNATSNEYRSNIINGNLKCSAPHNRFLSNNISGNITLNGKDYLFSQNTVNGLFVNGTSSGSKFVNNAINAEEYFELNGDVLIERNIVKTPKVILKTGTKTVNNTFIQTKDNDTDSFVTLYGRLFEGNQVSSDLGSKSHNVTYIYCTSDGTLISRNIFKHSPNIHYWLYSSRNVIISKNQTTTSQSFIVGEGSNVNN